MTDMSNYYFLVLGFGVCRLVYYKKNMSKMLDMWCLRLIELLNFWWKFNRYMVFMFLTGDKNVCIRTIKVERSRKRRKTKLKKCRFLKNLFPQKVHWWRLLEIVWLTHYEQLYIWKKNYYEKGVNTVFK